MRIFGFCKQNNFEKKEYEYDVKPTFNIKP